MYMDEEKSGDRVDEEIRFARLEATVGSLAQQLAALRKENIKTRAELTVTRKSLEAVKRVCKSTWKLERTNILFPNLEKLALHQSTPTYVETIPIPFPENTKAIIVQFFCNFWNAEGHVYLDVEIKQHENDEGGVAHIENTHYKVYANTFYYEIFVP